MAVRCDKLGSGTAVEVGYEAGEILREAETLQVAGQLVMVYRGEGSFQVQVAKIDIFVVCVGVFHTQTKVRDGFCA